MDYRKDSKLVLFAFDDSFVDDHGESRYAMKDLKKYNFNYKRKVYEL